MSVTRKERAIGYAKEHRLIHEKHRDYWRAHPPTTRDQRMERHVGGGIKHQEWAIRRYNLIIAVLESA
jgi:hypothetical protein